jgi:hypothetical protein
MAGMKEDRRYGSQRRIAGSDQQYERICQGDGKQPSPFSYAKELRKEVMPGSKKQEKAKHVMQDYLRVKKEAKINERKEEVKGDRMGSACTNASPVCVFLYKLRFDG